MRLLATTVLLLLASPVLAQAGPAFGAGDTTWASYAAPDGLDGAGSAGEPTIGIPWNTDDVFFMSGEAVFRIHFENGTGPTWDDVTPPNSVINVDPMLHADPELGRVWAGGLDGACSIMAYTDDNGATWLPTGNMCSGVQFDHQSIGSGPHALLPGNPTFEHMTYYCAQFIRTACTSSYDGGIAWGPVIPVQGDCGGLHGHIRVSRATGTAVVPHKNCGGQIGFAITKDDGLTWNSRTHPETNRGDGFDPSIQFGRDEGWMWMGYAGGQGAHIGLSKDEGATWEAIGGNMGNTSTWLDVGALHDPPITRAHFADVQVGDDDRVAFSFLGLVDREAGYGDTGDCSNDAEDVFWHYYVAMSWDAGETWTVQQATEDPVQVGSIFTGGFNPNADSSCRNLLDFNDMDIDSTGRVYVAFADGCTRACAEEPSPGSDGYRTRYATVLRQESGRGLFAEYDMAGAGPGATMTTPPGTDEDTPGAGALLLVSVLLMAVGLRRRAYPHPKG